MNSKTLQFQINLVAYGCLFASGMATLVYELIWFRYLTLVFGASLYALSAVLCAFMLGLAGGAWLMGEVLSRGGVSKQLILLYGFFEGLIGLYALSFPLGTGVVGKNLSSNIACRRTSWTWASCHGIHTGYSFDASCNLINGSDPTFGGILGSWK